MTTPSPTSQADLPSGNPLWEMVRLAAPTVATMVSYTLMQFVDGLMVAHITPSDPVYLAAQGNGGVWSFAPMSLMMGLLGVVNTYVSQNLGAGRPERGPAYAWTALWLSFFAWLFALIPFALILPVVFQRLGHTPRLVELETQYAQILLFGGALTMSTRALSQYFYGMHRPLVVLIAAVTGNCVNLACNWALIYGNLGFPALGVSGAAIATLIGSAVELAIPLALFLSARYDLAYHTRRAWIFSPRHALDILRIGWPPALMFGNELICWAVSMTAFQGHFGPAQNNASWIALRYMHLSFMPAVGLSFACTAVVGRCLGAGRPDLAAQRARIGVSLAMVYMGLCALAFILFREPMIRLFIGPDADPAAADAILRIGAQIMIVAAVFQVFDGLGITLIGVLRGAGDTVWPGVVTVILAWSCIVGLGAAFTFGWPALGALGPWIACGLYIILLGLALVWRFRSGAWKTMKILDRSASSDPAPPSPSAVQQAAVAAAST